MSENRLQSDQGFAAHPPARGDELALDVSILIVGYQSKDLMMDCLGGLFQHTQGVKFEVLYTDCSNDGSTEAVRDRHPSVRVIDNDENLGFGRGNNFIARHAKGDYLLLLNPDTLINDNAIGGLYEFAKQNPDGGAWGGVTRLPNGAIDPGCQQSAPSLFSMLMLTLGLAKLTQPDIESGGAEGADVHSLSGAFMMLPRALWEELGGFDESFFMYCEETDLCFRVRQAGKRVLLTSNSSIVHLVGAGSGQSPQRMIALTRGGTHFTRKHFSRLYCWADIAIRWIYSFSRYLLGVLGRPLIGADRAKVLRERHLPIVTKPGQWSRGWS